MSGWSHHDGLAVGLDMANVDTDQLIPARFMSQPRAAGYGRFLLHDLRGPGFALDAPAAAGASILVAGPNFGCGSSREAAVYALVDAGFRVVIAPSFGEIFAANAVNNGLLPARADTGALLSGLSPVAAPVAVPAAPPVALPVASPGLPARMQVDLVAQTVTGPGGSFAFALDPVWRTKLVNGWDDIDLTRSQADRIAAFRHDRRTRAPWVWPDDNRGCVPTTGRNR